jgi:hypothetical protein
MAYHIFAEKYENSMEELKGRISQENYEKLVLFFANTNLDNRQRIELIEIIEKIKVENNSDCCSENGYSCKP